MSTSQKFSHRLSALRKRLGISQAEAANMLGVSRNYVSMLEQGREPSVTLVTLFERIEKEHRLIDESATGYTPAPRLTGRALLKQAREKRGLTQSQLAKTVGYSTAVYQEIEDGGSQMGEKMAEKIARVLGIEMTDLLEGSDHPPENGTLHGTFGSRPSVAMGPGMEQSKAKFVPLLSLAQCGTQAAWTTEGYTKEGFLAFDPKDREAFAVTLAGDSMMPVYSPGDVALVYPTHAPRNGDLVIAVLDDDHGGDVMFKIYSASGDRVTLSSYNGAYPPLEFPRQSFRSLFPVAAVTKVLRRNGH